MHKRLGGPRSLLPSMRGLQRISSFRNVRLLCLLHVIALDQAKGHALEPAVYVKSQ